MVLIFAPEIIEINNNKISGIKFIATKKRNFLSLKFILNLILFIKQKHRKKIGIKIKNCLKIKTIGLIKWFTNISCPTPLLLNPY